MTTRKRMIPKNDIYTTAGNNEVYFKLAEKNKIIRDLNIVLEKNNVVTLKELAKSCEIKGASKLKKAELVTAVKGCLTFERMPSSISKPSSTKKLRPCKYGKRDVHGKCPKKNEIKKSKQVNSSSKTMKSNAKLLKLTAKEKRYVSNEWHHAKLSYFQLHPTEDDRYEDLDLTKKEIDEIIEKYGIKPPPYHWYWKEV